MPANDNTVPKFRLGEHVADICEHVPEGEPGSKSNPFTVAPEDWDDGFPYGAWCRCSKCNEIGRSTMAFDFYADAAGDPLTCETCSRKEW